ncbi:MAG: hypothetical protein ACLR0U_03530 [Enterocloster clostridioformis]
MRPDFQPSRLQADHDTTAGVDAAMEAGTKLGLEGGARHWGCPAALATMKFIYLDLFGHGFSLSAGRAQGIPPAQGPAQPGDAETLWCPRHPPYRRRISAPGIPTMVITRAHVARALLAKGLGPDLDHIFSRNI